MQLHTISYLRIVLTCLGVRGIFTVSTTFGYYEHKYFCEIDNDSIVVSIQQWNILCFDYLKSMQDEINELDNDILRAQWYVNAGTKDDQAYWNWVVENFSNKKQERVSLRDRVIVAVDDYELSLFSRVKGLTTYYLKPERELLFEKQGQATSLLVRLKAAGDVPKYLFVLEKLDGIQYRIWLLDQIRFSQNFSELIPPLKAYLQAPTINSTDVT